MNIITNSSQTDGILRVRVGAGATISLYYVAGLGYNACITKRNACM